MSPSRTPTDVVDVNLEQEQANKWLVDCNSTVATNNSNNNKPIPQPKRTALVNGPTRLG